MVQTKKRGLHCPLCHNNVAASRLVFYPGLRCVRCGSILRVPTGYVRTLVLLSFVIGFFLVWAAGVTNTVLFSLLWLPIGFLIGTLVVPAALHVLPPKLVTGDPGQV